MQSQDDYDYVQPAGWEEVKADAFGDDAPFKMYVNNFQSSSPRSEAFLHQPQRFLRAGEVLEEFGNVPPEPIPGVGPETKIQTWITNHHRTLSHMVLYATAIKSKPGEPEDTLSLTLYKMEPGGH